MNKILLFLTFCLLVCCVERKNKVSKEIRLNNEFSQELLTEIWRKVTSLEGMQHEMESDYKKEFHYFKSVLDCPMLKDKGDNPVLKRIKSKLENDFWVISYEKKGENPMLGRFFMVFLRADKQEIIDFYFAV